MFELKELRDLLNREIAICSNIVPQLSGNPPTLKALEKRMITIREMALSNVKFIMGVYPFMEKKEVVAQPKKEVVTPAKKEETAAPAQTNNIKEPEELAITF